MKQTAKRILAFVSVVCIAFLGIVTMPFVSVNAAEGQTAQLVTDVNDLAVGDQVIIAAASTYVALSTTQNDNNRGQVTITKNNDNTVTISDTVQILTLEAGTVDGTFAFNTGSGYLYAASSNKNYLRTQTTNNANGSWTITIDPKGVATVKAQGSNTRNLLRYNSSSTGQLFSCYSSGQDDICLYKLAEESEEVTAIREELNSVQAYMSMGYKYTQKTEMVDAPATTEKKVAFELDGAEGVNKDGTEVQANYSASTVDGYALTLTNCSKVFQNASDAKGNSCLKLGTSSVIGGFSMTVPDDVTSVIFDVAKYKAKTSKISVNGTAYTLVNSSDNGAYDVITVDTTTNKDITFTTVSGGVRAMINTITYVCKVKSDSAGDKVAQKLFSDVDFRLQCGVGASLLDIEGVDGYGIRVTANGKDVDYDYQPDSDTNLVLSDEDSGLLYVIIKLGDVLNNPERATTVFTVQAYVEVDGVKYVSDSVKEYSVASMIKTYYENPENKQELEGLDEKVAPLYHLLVEMKAIEEVA